MSLFPCVRRVWKRERKINICPGSDTDKSRNPSVPLSPPFPALPSSREGNSSLYLVKSFTCINEQLGREEGGTSPESLPQKSCPQLGLSDLGEEGSNLTVTDEDSAVTLSICKIKSGWEI